MNSLKQLLTPGSIVNNSNNNDTYCLRWTRHPNMLSDELSDKCHDSTPFLDVIIHLDDGSLVKLHSLVLAAFSQLFTQLGQIQPQEPSFHIVLPDTKRDDLMQVVNFLYTGTLTTESANLEAIINIASSLGITKLIKAVSESVKSEKSDGNSKKFFEPQSLRRHSIEEEEEGEEQGLPINTKSTEQSVKRSHQSLDEVPTWLQNKKLKLESLPMLQTILQHQFPMNQSFLNNLNANNFVQSEQKDLWSENSDEVSSPPEALGKLQSLMLMEAGSLQQHPSQLTNILTAAAKLKQVAEQAQKNDNFAGDSRAASDSSAASARKLAFHEPRPCPVCKRMYRDAATLRTHTAIMHSEGSEPFRCSCGVTFSTKYEMYQHKKAGHPPVK